MLAARSTSVRGSALATPRSRHASPALPTSVPARGASGFTHHGSYLGASNQFPMSFYDHTDQYVDRRGLGKRALPKDWRPEEWKPSGQNVSAQQARRCRDFVLLAAQCLVFHVPCAFDRQSAPSAWVLCTDARSRERDGSCGRDGCFAPIHV